MGTPIVLPAPRLASRLRGLAWMGYPLGLFALSRVAIFGVTALSLSLDPRLFNRGTPLANPNIDGLCRWDCLWFERIAIHGYDEWWWTNFFPLFPLLGRWANELTGWPVQTCLVLLANLFTLLAWVVVYRIFTAIEGRPAARVALALWAAWPFSFFQATGYPESLMALTTSGAVLLAMRARHFSAGAALGIGLLARHLTLSAGLALLVEQVRQRSEGGWRRVIFSRDVFALGVPFVFLGGWLWYQYSTFGDPIAFVHARDKWGKEAWVGLRELFFGNTVGALGQSYAWLSIIPGAGAFALLFRRRWWSLAAFAVPLMLLIWWVGLVGLGRYSAAVWPAFLPLGLWASARPWAQNGLLVGFALLQTLYLYLHVHLYAVL